MKTLYLHCGWLDVVAHLVPQHTGSPLHIHHHHCILLGIRQRLFLSPASKYNSLKGTAGVLHIFRPTDSPVFSFATDQVLLHGLADDQLLGLHSQAGRNTVTPGRGCLDLAEGSDILKIYFS